MSWLSPNPSKRWCEQFVLCYSPVWIVLIVGSELTHRFSHWGDGGHLAFGFLLALPLWLWPLLFPGAADRQLPVRERHVVRFNLFIAVWTFLQVYFGSDLFFDVLGMQYHFPVTWTLHRTPLFLYLVTVAYFSTYYVVLQIAWRAFLRRFPNARAWQRLLVLAALGYVVAFAETSGMANSLSHDYFSYADKRLVLLFGSLCYGSIFVVTLPLLYRLDERAQPDGQSSFASLAWDACAANTIVLILYAVYAALLRRF